MNFDPPKGFSFAEAKGKSRERGRENTRRVLVWALKWGWVTEKNIQHLLGVKRRHADHLVKKGLLEKNRSSSGRMVAYTINHEALMNAYELYEELDRADIALPYPWPQTQIPFAKLGNHQEIAQTIALDELYAHGGSLLVDRELRLLRGGAVPDFEIERNGKTEWHEVELNAKYAERLYFQMFERDQARQRGAFDSIVWWCRGEPVARVIRAALNSQTLPQVTRRADGKIVRLPGVEGWSPRKLLSVSDIRVIGKPTANQTDIRHLSPGNGLQSEIDVDDL